MTDDDVRQTHKETEVPPAPVANQPAQKRVNQTTVHVPNEPSKKKRRSTVGNNEMYVPLATETKWDPSTVKVTLNITLDKTDGVPTLDGKTESRVCHVVVLDKLFGELERKSLLDFITEPSWDHTKGPPSSKWERATSDGPGLPLTWGLTSETLNQLGGHKTESELQTEDSSAAPSPEASLRTSMEHAMREIGARLTVLYPDMTIVHQPSNRFFTPQCTEETEFSCDQFVCNAPVYGDCFQWHMDLDPMSLPPSPWVQANGRYCNQERGKPLFVSLLLYLIDKWPAHYDGETLFMDPGTDCGVFVRPKAYRAVLMDQDTFHRLSTPSQLAQGRPRYSLVWKLLFLPKSNGQVCSIARSDWGPPTAFGSSAS